MLRGIIADVHGTYFHGGGSSVFERGETETGVLIFCDTDTPTSHQEVKLKSNISSPLTVSDSEGRGAIMRVQGKHHLSFRLEFVTSIFYNHRKVLHIVIYLCNRTGCVF